METNSRLVNTAVVAHGWNDTHVTDGCKVIQAMLKEAQGGNKTWKRSDADKESTDGGSKKEIAAMIQLIHVLW